MNKPLSLAEKTRVILAERFPNCFMPKKAEKLPLAVGIHKQVFRAAPDLSRRAVRLAIQDYCTGVKYFRNMKPGATRINLDGSPGGIVSKACSRYSRVRIRKLETKWYNERKARREMKTEQKVAA